jgi:hypothetical protein
MPLLSEQRGSENGVRTAAGASVFHSDDLQVQARKGAAACLSMRYSTREIERGQEKPRDPLEDAPEPAPWPCIFLHEAKAQGRGGWVIRKLTPCILGVQTDNAPDPTK